MHETVAEATGLHDQAGNGTSHGHRIHFRNHWWNEAMGEQEASQSLEICLGSNLTNTTLRRRSKKGVEKIQRAQILSDSCHLAYCLLLNLALHFDGRYLLTRQHALTGRSVSDGARLPPQLTINTVPCQVQVSSMYDVTSTCLNMLA